MSWDIWETVVTLLVITLVVGGIVGGTLWSIRRGRRAHLGLKAEWSRYAPDHELAWLPALEEQNLGRAWGVVAGREVLVTPDETDKLRVALVSPLPLRLTHNPTPVGGKDEPMFHLGRPALDKYFHGRAALAPGYAELIQRPTLLAELESFVETHGPGVLMVQIGPQQITCSPHRGSLSARHWEGDGVDDYITPGQVDVLLPALFRLADVLDGGLAPGASVAAPDIFDTHEIGEVYRLRVLTELAAMAWVQGPPRGAQRAALDRYAGWLGLGQQRQERLEPLCAVRPNVFERDYRRINIRKRARLLQVAAHFVYLAGPVHGRAVAQLEELTAAMQIPAELTQDWLALYRGTARHVTQRAKQP